MILLHFIYLEFSTILWKFKHAIFYFEEPFGKVILCSEISILQKIISYFTLFQRLKLHGLLLSGRKCTWMWNEVRGIGYSCYLPFSHKLTLFISIMALITVFIINFFNHNYWVDIQRLSKGPAPASCHCVFSKQYSVWHTKRFQSVFVDYMDSCKAKSIIFLCLRSTLKYLEQREVHLEIQIPMCVFIKQISSVKY